MDLSKKKGSSAWIEFCYLKSVDLIEVARNMVELFLNLIGKLCNFYRMVWT